MKAAHADPHQSSVTASMANYFHDGSQHLKSTLYQQRWTLLGTAGAWFILDVVFYANGLFSGQVTRVMGISDTPKGEAEASLVLQLIALPGYLFTVRFIDAIGAKRLQSIGFIATGIFFMLLAAWQPYLVEVCRPLAHSASP